MQSIKHAAPLCILLAVAYFSVKAIVIYSTNTNGADYQGIDNIQ